MIPDRVPTIDERMSALLAACTPVPFPISKDLVSGLVLIEIALPQIERALNQAVDDGVSFDPVLVDISERLASQGMTLLALLNGLKRRETIS